MIKLVDNVR